MNNNEKIREIAATLRTLADEIDELFMTRGVDTQLENEKEISFTYTITQLKEEIQKCSFTVNEINKIETELNDELISISKFIGDKFDNILFAYNLLKRDLSAQNGFRINMAGFSPQKIGDITNLFTRLKKIMFLQNYYYNKEGKFLTARVNNLPTANFFLSGGWLEKYVELIVKEECEKKQLQYVYASNIKGTYGDNQDFELDLAALIGNELFWFEAKTGDPSKHAKKYSKYSKLLKTGVTNGFLVLEETNKANALVLYDIFKMTVCPINQFREIFNKRLNQINS
jgi:hypothetical protein